VISNHISGVAVVHYKALIDQYLAGPELVQSAIRGMSEEQLDAKPIAGKWSTRQVVCHIADFEPIYADRMKRVIAERCPTFFGGDPDTFAAGLAYNRRPVGTELEVLAVVRRQMATILRELQAEDFQRTGKHSEAGPLTLEALLYRIRDHVPHHIQFIAEKRKSLGI
jgi:uncharacterized damage-inducible protein DinB